MMLGSGGGASITTGSSGGGGQGQFSGHHGGRGAERPAALLSALADTQRRPFQLEPAVRRCKRHWKH